MSGCRIQNSGKKFRQILWMAVLLELPSEMWAPAVGSFRNTGGSHRDAHCIQLDPEIHRILIDFAMPKTTIWFGTNSPSGIFRSSIDLESGSLAPAEQVAELARPGFLTLNSDGTRLISTVRTEEHAVAMFEIVGSDPETRSLRELQRVATGIPGPTHLNLSSDGGTLLVAHYSGGGVAALPILDDGSIGECKCSIQHSGSSVAPRQTEAHPHWIGEAPNSDFVLVPDLGTDQVVIYRLDRASSVLIPHGAGTVPPGSGPRHIAFHPADRRVFVANELTLTVSVFEFDPTAGTLNLVSTHSSLPEADRKVDCTASEIQIHPNGKFVYLGIRGNDTIATFAIEASGELTLIEREPIRGSWPRHFAIDPTGRWLVAAGAKTNTATVFAVDQHTGRMQFTGNSINVENAICVVYQI